MGCKIDISNLRDVSVYLAGVDRRFNYGKCARAVSGAFAITGAGASADAKCEQDSGKSDAVTLAVCYSNDGRPDQFNEPC